MAPRFRPSGWAGRDARLVGTRPRVRGCPRQCWHFCCLPALSRRSGDVGSLPPPRSSEIEATHPHVKCRTGACRLARPAHGTGGGCQPGRGLRQVPRLVYSDPSIREVRPMPRRRSNPLALAVLACLTEQPMHPYEMAATMRTRGQDAEHPPELRLAVRRGREPAQAGTGRGARGGARRPPARTHRLPHHRRGPGRGRRVDGGAARAVGQGVPAVRGRAVADGGPSAGPRRRPARERDRRVAGAAVGARRHRRGRDAATAYPACSSSRWTTSGRWSTPIARSPNSSRPTSSRNRLDGVTFWKDVQRATTEQRSKRP